MWYLGERSLPVQWPPRESSSLESRAVRAWRLTSGSCRPQHLWLTRARTGLQYEQRWTLVARPFWVPVVEGRVSRVVMSCSGDRGGQVSIGKRRGGWEVCVVVYVRVLGQVSVVSVEGGDACTTHGC